MAEGEIRVKQVRSAIGVKPKHRGTLRALGLGRIGRSRVLPDRPEIRGMVASVVHLVEVERRRWTSQERSKPMKVHELTPAPGSTRHRRRVGRGIAGKGGKTAGRGTKGAGARGNIKPGFEGGQLPLTQRIPKLKGFKNPFRVEYTVVNLDCPGALGVAESGPCLPTRSGPCPQAGPGQSAGRGPGDAADGGFCARVFRLGQFRHRGRRRVSSRASASVRSRPAPRKGQRVYQSVVGAARTISTAGNSARLPNTIGVLLQS